ncbi:MAG: 2-C-methyl-D-erythritol 2,4-cyclodiphosphate synthase [Balneolaceae bacterium]|nr:MAG: 2-C-methyl-D-erythritol 2,4-cyclodiphosphate synthase [Balneolaceae bacterium]
MRIGLGYDVHSFREGDGIILGGVSIPFDKSLKGHSDADVLLHAITDAILGALALGDLGEHFPDTDPAYKGIDSKILLAETYSMMIEKGYVLVNLDATVVAEKPKLNPHMHDIRHSISECLHCDIEQVSVKATTSEKMGFIGREEGIAVHAIVLIQRV